MKRRRLCLLAASLLPVAGFLPAADQSITLEEWLVEALARHPAVKLADTEIEARTLRSEQRIVWEDPELRIGSDNRPGDRDQTAVSLRFPIPHPGTEGALADREEARLDLARAEYAAAVRTAREDLGRLYLEAAAAQMMASLLLQQETAMAEVIGSAEKMLLRSASTRQELLEWKIDYADAVMDLSEMEAEAETLLLRVREYLPELPPETNLLLAMPRLSLEGTPPSATELSRAILESDPRLAQRLAEVRIATAAVAAERARRIPFPTFVQGSWVQDQRRDQDEWEARIGISVPLFSWIRDADPRDRADAILAESALTIEREEIRHMALRVHRECNSSRNRFEALQSSISPLLEELAASLTDSRLSLDPGDRLDLIGDLFRLQGNLLEADLQYQLAAWSLHTLVWNWQP